MEQEFKTLVDSIGEEIEAKLQQAHKLVKEACALADQHGVPFYSPVSTLGQNYVPELFGAKFSSLSKADITDLTSVPEDALFSPYGWNTSGVC